MSLCVKKLELSWTTFGGHVSKKEIEDHDNKPAHLGALNCIKSVKKMVLPFTCIHLKYTWNISKVLMNFKTSNKKFVGLLKEHGQENIIY